MGLNYQKIGVRVLGVLMAGLLVFNVFTAVAGSQTIQKTFKSKTTIKLQMVSGNCIVKKSTDGAITVNVAAASTPVFSEKNDVLTIKDESKGAGKGTSTWTLAIPDKVKVEFSSGTGSFSLTGLDTSVSIQTGTGNIKLQDVSGTITANSGTGKIELHNIAGTIQANGGTSSIIADGIELKGASQFMSGAGNAQVSLAKTAEYDLMVSAATGKATLNYNGNPLKGYFELQGKVSGGTITAPIQFFQQKVVDRSGEKYMIKSVSKGGNSPKIQVLTGSGQAILSEK